MARNTKTNTPKEVEKTKEAEAPQAEAKAETKTVEKAVEMIKEFNPKKLRSMGSGGWIYAEDPEKVERDLFHHPKAKDYGLKENDVVFVVNNGIVKTIGV